MAMMAVGFSTAQNLVVNPSFEITASNCSNFGGEGFFTDLTGSWNNASNNVGGDSCSSPDLFAPCNTIFGSPGPTHMPNSLLGYQYSRTGTRHAGIITYEALDEYREYIQGHTSVPLTAGTTYCVSFYVSLGNDVAFATDNMGVYFSNTEYLRDPCPGGTNSGIYETPQLNHDCAVLTDTANWVRLQWDYTASGGEQYFVIGNFFNNANTNVVTTGGGLINPYAYYFIDDVSIVAESCCFADIETVDVQCVDDPAFNLVATAGIGSNCSNTVSGTWSGQGITNASLGTFDPATAGLGVHTINLTLSCGYVASTTVIVSACATLSLCLEANGDLTVTGGTGPYTWNSQTLVQDCSACLDQFPIPPCSFPPGCVVDVLSWTQFATGSTVTPPGTFPLQVLDSDGGLLEISSLVGIDPCNSVPCGLDITLISSQDACDGNTNGSITVNASGGVGSVSMSWNTAPVQSGVTATGLPAGTYTVLATDQQNCIDSLVVTINTESVNAVASEDVTICKGDSTELSATGGSSYVWNNGGGIGSPVTVFPAGTTTYTVTATGPGGCPGTDDVVVTVYQVPAVVIDSVASIVCSNAGSIQLSGTPLGGVFVGPGVTNGMFDPAAAGVGTHQIIYTYFEQVECPNSDTISIAVDICTDLENVFGNDESFVQPNPSTGIFGLTNLFTEPVDVVVSDVTGRLILKSSNVPEVFNFDLSSVETGNYILSIRSTRSGAVLQTKKLMKR